MTTPTTNYGWLKPDPDEPADIAVINTLLDDIDADIKTVSDTLTSKVYKAAQYRVKRKFTLIGGGGVVYLTSSLPDLWVEDWVSNGNTGGWTFPGTGILRFTEAGVYRLSYLTTMSTYQIGTTSGYLALGLYDDSAALRPRTRIYQRSNTCDNVTNFPRTTIQGSIYIWAGSGSDQCVLNTDYRLGAQHHTSGGSVSTIFTPNDIKPFRTQFTLECVRKLSS